MKINRMFGILCRLLDRNLLTAKELAEYFEVSVRTIHRDLMDLSEAGFPVVTRQGVGGGVYLLDNFRYNKAILNEEERNMLSAGLNSLNTIDDSSRIKTLMAKLRLGGGSQMVLEHDIVVDFTDWHNHSVLTEKIREIRVGIKKKQQLEIRYYSGSSDWKTVDPYKLIFKAQNWYLSAFSVEKQDYRLYKLSRIIELRTTPAIFTERDDYQLPELKSDFVNNSGQTVLVRVDLSFEFLMVDFFGLDNIRRDENGDLLVEFQTEETVWVIQVFAELGGMAEIISPKALREEMRAFLTAALKRYET